MVTSRQSIRTRLQSMTFSTNVRDLFLDGFVINREQPCEAYRFAAVLAKVRLCRMPERSATMLCYILTSQGVIMAKSSRGALLTVFAVLFAVLACSNFLKPFHLDPNAGLMFFGTKTQGIANAILGPPSARC
jgi:hypothetical protein